MCKKESLKFPVIDAHRQHVLQLRVACRRRRRPSRRDRRVLVRGPKADDRGRLPAFGAPAAVAAAAPIAGFSFGAMSEDSKQPSHDDNDDMAGRSFNCSVCYQDLAPPDDVTQRHPEMLRHLREDCPYRSIKCVVVRCYEDIIFNKLEYRKLQY